MPKTYMIVLQRIYGTPGDWVTDYSTDGKRWPDRAKAIRETIAELEHDDFNVATIEGGKVVAFGFDLNDFGPDDGYDLAEIQAAVLP